MGMHKYVSRCTNRCNKKNETLGSVRSHQRTDTATKPPGYLITVLHFAVEKRPETSCLRKGFRITKASTQLLEMLQAYARLPLRPTVHKKRPRRVCNALLYNNVTGQDIMCTYVTSQLFFRRRFSQPPRAHHIPPAHSCSFLRSLSADFGSASFVFGSVFSYLKRGERTLTQHRNG